MLLLSCPSVTAFRRNACKTFSPYAIGLGMVVRSFVQHEISPANISRTVCSRITRFLAEINTYIVYSHTGYGVIICLKSKVIAMKKKLSEIPPPTASGRISREQFKHGSRYYTYLLSTVCLTNLPDMTSLSTSCRQQNATKYCPKVLKRIRSDKDSNNSTTV